MQTKLEEKLNTPSYYNMFRQGVLDVIPSDASRVLSVGCATGVTEAELVKRGIEVVGIEMNSKAAEIARHKGIIVLEGNASEVDLASDNKLYDCIVYADILEHLADPQEVMKHHITYLKPGGIVYISIPNFRNWNIFWQLFIRGRVEYVEAGILDKTHIRITTRKMVLRWFKDAGVEVISVRHLIHGRKNKIISYCSFGLLKEFVSEQIGVVGKKIS